MLLVGELFDDVGGKVDKLAGVQVDCHPITIEETPEQFARLTFTEGGLEDDPRHRVKGVGFEAHFATFFLGLRGFGFLNTKHTE